jgi:hypothetical protein
MLENGQLIQTSRHRIAAEVIAPPNFECGAFNHSATSPESKQAIKSPNRGRFLTKRDKTDKGREAYIKIYR